MARSEQKSENLQILLAQHWLHCRHLENERAWFLNVYGAVVGGILVFSAQGIDNNIVSINSALFYALISFLIAITFFGFFLTLRWIHAFECHRRKVNELAKVLWSISGVKVPLDPTMNIPQIHIMLRPCKVVDEIFRTRYWFPLFYFIVLMGITLFLFLFIKTPISMNEKFWMDGIFWMKGISMAALIVALWLGIGWYFSLREAK